MLDPFLPMDPAHFAVAATLLMGGALLVASRPAGWVVRRPRTVLALLLLVTLGALAVLIRIDPVGLRLEIDPSTEPLLPRNDPGAEVYRRAVLDFGDDQVFVIAMECGDVFTEENLSALRRVTDEIARLDGVRSVKSLLRVTWHRYVPEQDWIEVRPFIEDVPSDPRLLARLREQALSDPVYRKTFVSPDARAAAINVSFREMSDAEFIAADLDGAIRRIVEGEAGPERSFYVSGRPHIKSVMYHAMTRDLAVLIPVAFGVVAVMLASVAGSIRSVLLPLATVATAILWTFGAIALLGRPLTVLTVLLAPTLLAVGSVYGVHVVARYEEEVLDGEGPRAAATEAWRQMIVPMLIAGLTTVVGFGALLLTDVPAVFEIGAFSVLGVTSVTLISLTGIPAALVLLPPPRRTLRSPFSVLVDGQLERALTGLARLAVRRSGVIIALGALATGLALAAIPRIEIDTDYLSFFDEDAPVRVEFERIDELLAGVVPLFVVLEGSEPGRLREPDLLRAIERAQTRIDDLPGVSRTLSFLDTLRLINRAISGDDPAQERIPDTRPAITELLFMLPKSDLQRFVTVDHSSANLVVRTGAVGSAALRELTGRIEAVLADSLNGELDAHITGNAILLTRAADGVAESQPRTVGLAALTIFALLAGGLGSVRLGLVAMIPNVVPVVLFFGLLGAGAAPLSLPTSLIGSVALGIAIDATAHYLVRYREARRAGLDPGAAVLLVNQRVGRPIAIASATLILGFLSVALSEFSNLREFGVLTALTMAICAVTDLVLLPAVLVRLRI